MKLNPNAWFVKFYRFFYGENELEVMLNTRGCPFFWKFMFALISIPFTIMPMAIGKLYDRNWYVEVGVGASYVISAISFVIGLTFIEKIFHISGFTNVYDMIFLIFVCTYISTVALALFGIFIFLIIIGFTYVQENLPKRNQKYDEDGWRVSNTGFFKMLKIGIISFYDKNCPVIEWKKEDI